MQNMVARRRKSLRRAGLNIKNDDMMSDMMRDVYCIYIVIYIVIG